MFHLTLIGRRRSALDAGACLASVQHSVTPCEADQVSPVPIEANLSVVPFAGSQDCHEAVGAAASPRQGSEIGS
jgi:hypothetical protein